MKTRFQYCDLMKVIPNSDPIFSSGIPKFSFWFGLGLIALSIYLITFKGETLHDATVLIAVALGCLFFSRPGKVKLYSDKLTIRSFTFSRKTFALENLSWAHFPDDGGAILYFGDKAVTLNSEVPGHKQMRSVLEEIAPVRLPYWGYKITDRTSIKRGQLSGCLDCHSLFLPQDIKAWKKVPKSYWRMIKTDLFYPKCPECGEQWVFTDQVAGGSVTLGNIQKMDTNLGKNPQGIRYRPAGIH